MTADMHLPEVVSPEEWLAARKDLLVKEEEASLVSTRSLRRTSVPSWARS